MISFKFSFAFRSIIIVFLILDYFQAAVFAQDISQEQIDELDLPYYKEYRSRKKEIENKLVLGILIQTLEENLPLELFQKSLNENPFSALDLDKDGNVDFISVMNYRIRNEFKIALFSSSSLEKDLLVALMVFNLETRCFKIQALKEVFIDDIYIDRFGCIEDDEDEGEGEELALSLTNNESRQECYRVYNEKIQAASEAGTLTPAYKRKLEQELRRCRGTTNTTHRYNRLYGRGLFWTSLQDRPYHKRHTHENPPDWYKPKANKPLKITSNGKRGTSGNGKL